MEKVLKTLEFDKVLEFLSKSAISKLGAQRCFNALIYNDFDKIGHELKLTSQAKKILDNALNIPIEDIQDVEKPLEECKRHVSLNSVEIFEIAKILRTTRLTKNFFEHDFQDWQDLAELKEFLYPNKELEDKIFDTFDDNLNIKDGASLELKSLRRSFKDTENNIKMVVQNLLANPGFTNYLQDNVYTIRENRIVFQVKAENKNKVKGIVHDVSASAQTYFIEPKEIIGLNNKLREIQNQIKIEIERILKELSNFIKDDYDGIFSSFKLLIEFDFIFSKAKYSIKTNSIEPDITKDAIISLKGMKNPVLMSVCDDVIENDFEIGRNYNCVIITGSNTGGKTVALKTVGLCTLMCKAGLHIPCHEATIHPFGKIFADIGDAQNIIQSLSTFSSHMKNIMELVNDADGNTLVLLDEIVAGTDPKEGSALAQAVLEYLQKKGARTVVTTHFGELKSLAYLNSGFENASVEFDINTLRPTYKLLAGIPGASNAIIIAKNLGLKNEIIDAAKTIYQSENDNSAIVLQELQKTQQTLSQSAQKAIESRDIAENLEKHYAFELNKIKKEKKKNLEIYKRKYEGQIEAAKSEIKQILDELRQEKSEKIARRSYSRLAKIDSKIHSQFRKDENEISTQYQDVDWTGVKISDKLLIREFNQQVELLSLPDKNDKVQIQMGQIKTLVNIDKLAKFDKSLTSTSPKKRHVYDYDVSTKPARYEMSQTLDLRGFRLEEALDELEAYLDKASLANLTPVYVIHGHGTGVLKQGVRDYLTDSPYVAKFRPGEAAEGGDGIVVVDIN